VRIRAALGLAGYPRRGLGKPLSDALQSATQEMLRALLARPDTWHAHYNVGNYYLERGMLREAVHSYQVALELEPQAVTPMVNMAMAYARAGSREQAERQLRRALELAPGSAAANFNLGLLLSEQGKPKDAERHLRAALKADPQMAQAAYNLGLLLMRGQPKEALRLCLMAYELQPNPRYGYTLAYMMRQGGDARGAAGMLESVAKRWPSYADAYLLWADILRGSGETPAAINVLQQALRQPGLSPRDRRRLGDMAARLEKPVR